MGVCFLHGNGASNPLNYRVKAYKSADDLDFNPRGMIIGVITDTKITSHVIDYVKPTGKEGMVWFSTAEVSGLSFDALTENVLTIRPKGCQQYVSGAWQDKPAYIFLDGKWREWRKYLWNFGQGEAFTATAMPLTPSGDGQTCRATTLADGSKKYTQEASKGSMLYIDRPINLTNYNTLIFTGTMYGGSSTNGNHCALYVWNSRANMGCYTDNVVASLTTLNKEIAGDRYLDISPLSGEHYIGFGIYGSSAYILLQTLRLETAKIEEVKASDT